MAYRGRLLVSLETHLGETPETGVEDMLNEDVYKVQVYTTLNHQLFDYHIFQNVVMLQL